MKNITRFIVRNCPAECRLNLVRVFLDGVDDGVGSGVGQGAQKLRNRPLGAACQPVQPMGGGGGGGGGGCVKSFLIEFRHLLLNAGQNHAAVFGKHWQSQLALEHVQDVDDAADVV